MATTTPLNQGERENINRKAVSVSFTIASAATTSEAIDMRGVTHARLWKPATMTGNAITFTGASTSGGTHVALDDETGTALALDPTSTSAAECFRLPDAIFPLAELKIVSDETEGAERTFTIVLQS